MPQPENCIPTNIKVGVRCEVEADALDPAALAIRGIHAQHNWNVEKFFRVATLKRGVDIGLCPASMKRSHSCTGDVYCVSLNVRLWPDSVSQRRTLVGHDWSKFRLRAPIVE